MIFLRPLFLVIFLIHGIIQCSTADTKLSSKEKNRLSKIRKFTVLVFDRDGKEQVQLETYRTGMFFSKNENLSGGMRNLNSIYGMVLQSILQKKLEISGVQEMVEFIPPEKLFLIRKETGDEDLNTEWLKSLQIDAVFTIRQESLVLDYPTRLPNLGLVNLFYTFLLLDLWYVDLVGPWFLRSEFGYSVTFPKIQKENSYRSFSKKLYLGTFDYSQLSVGKIEDALIETARQGLSEGIDFPTR